MEDNSGKFQWTATVVNINNPDNDIRKAEHEARIAELEALLAQKK